MKANLTRHLADFQNYQDIEHSFQAAVVMEPFPHSDTPWSGCESGPTRRLVYRHQGLARDGGPEMQVWEFLMFEKENDQGMIGRRAGALNDRGSDHQGDPYCVRRG